MKKNAILMSMGMMLSTPVFADTIGLYIGGHVWDNSASGTYGESTGQVHAGLKDQTQNSFFVAIEHPFPLIPNIKIASTDLDTNGSTSLIKDFEFGGENYAMGSDISTKFDVSYVDYTMYYELFDNGLFSFDLGVTARDFESDIYVTSLEEVDEPASSKLSSSEIVPMVYVSTNVGLPLTGFNVYAQGNLLSLDDSTMYDYEVGVSYELIDNLAIDVNLTVGYRAVKLDVEDIDDLYTDLDFDGVYAGAVVHF